MQQEDMVSNKEGMQTSQTKEQMNKVEDKEGELVRVQRVVEKDDQLDPGSFTQLEAYSPLTPAKAKKIPDLPVNSPVFHTRSRETTA